MKLSTRSTYGMRALVELALAGTRQPVSAAHIAKRQELSVAYLEQLLHRLRREGIVTSIRGPRGGYVLARHPNQITMAAVVGILDGNGAESVKEGVRPRRTASNGRARSGVARAESKDAHRHAQRIAQAVWRCVHERLTQSLDAVTLQDLCEVVRTEAGEPLDHRYVFHI
jgi:Rrf2 family protein